MEVISYLTKVGFGSGAVAALAEEARALGIRRPLLVTDRGLVAAGLADRVLREGGLPATTPVFDGTPENPTEAAILACLTRLHAEEADGIIALGGGSPMDLAKAVALLATHPGPLAQYAAILGGGPRITAAVLPVIAVPTTAGTGSEVGRAALITLEDGRKLGIISPNLIPRAALCDPALTLGLPAGLTAATGMDALTHCIETFLSPRRNPPAEAIALDGLARGWAAIRRAVAQGGDLAAREAMMMTALEGGLTFQKGLGAVHSLSHALGSLSALRLHHGTLNAVLLPAVLRFNAPGAEPKYARLRAAMGLPDGADLADAVAALNADLGLPDRLGRLGVTADLMPDIVEKAFQDHSTPTNARPVTRTDLAALLSETL